MFPLLILISELELKQLCKQTSRFIDSFHRIYVFVYLAQLENHPKARKLFGHGKTNERTFQVQMILENYVLL